MPASSGSRESPFGKQRLLSALAGALPLAALDPRNCASETGPQSLVDVAIDIALDQHVYICRTRHPQSCVVRANPDHLIMSRI